MLEDGPSILVLPGRVPTLSFPLPLNESPASSTASFHITSPLLLLPVFGLHSLRGFGGASCKGGGVLEMGNR